MCGSTRTMFLRKLDELACISALVGALQRRLDHVLEQAIYRLVVVHRRGCITFGLMFKKMKLYQEQGQACEGAKAERASRVVSLLLERFISPELLRGSLRFLLERKRKKKLPRGGLVFTARMLVRRLLQAVFQAFAAALEATPVSACVTAEYRNDCTCGVMSRAPGRAVLTGSQDASGFRVLTCATARSSLFRWHQLGCLCVGECRQEPKSVRIELGVFLLPTRWNCSWCYLRVNSAWVSLPTSFGKQYVPAFVVLFWVSPWWSVPADTRLVAASPEELRKCGVFWGYGFTDLFPYTAWSLSGMLVRQSTELVFLHVFLRAGGPRISRSFLASPEDYKVSGLFWKMTSRKFLRPLVSDSHLFGACLA